MNYFPLTVDSTISLELTYNICIPAHDLDVCVYDCKLFSFGVYYTCNVQHYIEDNMSLIIYSTIVIITHMEETMQRMPLKVLLDSLNA